MGYKIEIVLVSIAVFLCGCIILCTALFGKSEPIVVEKYVTSADTKVLSAESDKDEVTEKTEEPEKSEVIDKTEVTKKAHVLQTSENTKAEKSETELVTVSDKVNINTATKEELMSLQGIGEVLSDRIIEYRKNAKFNSIDEIQLIKGIGEKTFEKLKDSITV